MLSVSFSFSNLGEWTPMTTSSLAYFFSSLARSGRMWMQLMQQSVQKSRRTTLPLRSFELERPGGVEPGDAAVEFRGLDRRDRFLGRTGAAGGRAAGEQQQGAEGEGRRGAKHRTEVARGPVDHGGRSGKWVHGGYPRCGERMFRVREDGDEPVPQNQTRTGVNRLPSEGDEGARNPGSS